MRNILKKLTFPILLIIVLIYIFGGASFGDGDIDYVGFNKNGAQKEYAYLDVIEIHPIIWSSKNTGSSYYCMYIDEHYNEGIIKIKSDIYDKYDVQRLINNRGTSQRFYGKTETIPQYVRKRILNDMSINLDAGDVCLNADITPVKSKGILDRILDVLKVAVTFLVILIIPAIVICFSFLRDKINLIERIKFYKRKSLYKRIKKKYKSIDENCLKKIFTLNQKNILVGEKITKTTGEPNKSTSSIKNDLVRAAAEGEGELHFVYNLKDNLPYMQFTYSGEEENHCMPISYETLNHYVFMDEKVRIKYKVLDEQTCRKLFKL